MWICPAPNGHLQAVGTDDAGRRQYLYHQQWRLKRDESKHDRVLEVAGRLPRARRRVAVHLQLDGMPYERALGTAFRLLDLGFFRIGGEAYAEANHSYGLATIRKEHVTVEGNDGRLRLRRQVRSGALRRAGRRPGPGLGRAISSGAAAAARSCWPTRTGDGGSDVTSADINAYVKEQVGGEVSAKDFRTWHGTVIAAVALAGANADATTATARKRAVTAAMKEVAELPRQHPDGGAEAPTWIRGWSTCSPTA